MSTPYLVRTSDPEIKGVPKSHPLDPSAFSISTVPHWHSTEDEWFYIIKAGEGARIVLYEDGNTESREEEVKMGDFFGFPAATKIGHAYKTGADEMVYFVGGTRKEMDVAHYPAAKMKAVVDRTGPGLTYWTVKEEHVLTPKDQPFKK